MAENKNTSPLLVADDPESLEKKTAKPEYVPSLIDCFLLALIIIGFLLLIGALSYITAISCLSVVASVKERIDNSPCTWNFTKSNGVLISFPDEHKLFISLNEFWNMKLEPDGVLYINGYRVYHCNGQTRALFDDILSFMEENVLKK